MVAYKISTTEGKPGDVPESTVLSRVRMLESNDNRGTDTPPLPARKALQHPVFRRSEEGAQQETLDRDFSGSSDRSDSREKRSSLGTFRNMEPKNLATNATHESRVPSTHERSLGFIAPRDPPLREKEPNGAYKSHTTLTTNDTRRANPSPRGDPMGYRGTLPATSRRTLSESPLRQTHKVESPSRGPPTKDTTSSSVTKKFDNWDKAPVTRNNPFEPAAPSSSQRKQPPSPNGSSRDAAREQLAATYFTSLRKSAPDKGTNAAEQKLVRPVAVLPSALLPKKDGRTIEEDRAKEDLAGETKRGSFRKVEQLSALVRSPDQLRASPQPTKSDNALPVRPRAPSPLPNLQRHHWDKKNEPTAAKHDETAVLAGVNSTSFKKGLQDPSNGVVELNWPSVSLKTSNFSKDGSSASSSSQGLQKNALQAGPRATGIGAKIVAPKHGIQALKQNLNDASTVMIDERASNADTSSSSGRSTLSQKELGGIASKALKLYQTRIDTQATRNKNSMLHQMLTEKRTVTKPIAKANVQSKTAEKQSSAEPFAYSSAARLSERLTRAERFSALKESRIKSRMQSEDMSMFSADSSLSPVKKSTHPVFGYSNRDLTINMQDDASAVPSEPSCIRRSKHLSKVMQQKADHFASASPTRRMKNANGYRNHQETRGLAPSKNYIPYQHDRSNPSHVPPKRHSPKKRSTAHYRREVNGDGTGSVLHPTIRGLNNYPPAGYLGGLSDDDQRYESQTRLPDKAREQYMAYEKKLHQHRMAHEDEAPSYHNHTHHFDHENFHIDDQPDETFGGAVSFHAAGGTRGQIGHPSVRTGPRMPALLPHQHMATQHSQLPHRSPGQHLVYEAKQDLDSQFMSEVSDDGPATIGDDSAQDNTFTGSLNKHEVGDESSDSYASRPDAFQWLHQKYGTQAQVAAKPTESLARTKVKPDVRMRSIENLDDDEEDDIFFGLEEAQSEDIEAKPKKTKKPSVSEPVRVKTDRLYVDADANVDKHDGQRVTEAVGATAGQREAAILEEHPKQIAKSKRNVPQNAAAKVKASAPEVISSTEMVNDVMEHSVQMVNAVDSEKSVASDMTSSLIVDKGWKNRYRPNPVDTIVEEPHAPISVDDEDATADEDSLRDGGKPSASMFKNLSTAFVKSIQQACKMPGKMPDLTACAVDTKMKCDEKMSEAWVGLSEEDAIGNEDDTATATATVTVGQSEAGTVAEETLNDVERRIWAAWDNRDQNLSEMASEMVQSANDVPRQTSDSSMSNTSKTHSHHQERRTEAQNKLLQHAERAMELFAANPEKFATLSTESSISQGPKPKPDDETPSSRLSAALSFEQRAVLERFSSSLKNEGVPVLKLSRRNKWQVRYLTVSKEVTMLSPVQDAASSISQCPKALLWPKRIVRGHSSTISNIMANGRGGVPFEKIQQVRQVASNEYYDRNLSRKFRREFPVFAGVAVDYVFDGGERQMHLCFKSKIDAQAFVTAMLIIREATERAVGKGDRKLESYPTESSGTKSFEN